MRTALRAVHAAERDLLWAAHRAALAQLLQALAADAAQGIAARSQAITAHHASKVAALDPGLSPQARAAAIARIRGEEAAEIAQMLLDESRRAAGRRASSIAALKSGQRQTSTAMRTRHRRERAVLSVAVRHRTRLVGGRHRSWQAVRSLTRRLRR